MSKRDNIIKWSIISIFVGLYSLVSIISTIHVIEFFRLSNPEWLAVTLAIAFEIGAAASLAAIVILDKTSKSLVWMLFLLITLMQMMGNMYYAYVHLEDFKSWSELFGIMEEEIIFQKRILSIVSGAILPIVALGFIKSLVDYIKPSTAEELKAEFEKNQAIEEELERENRLEIQDRIEDYKEEEAREEALEQEIAQDLIEDSLNESVMDDHEEIEAIKADDTITDSEKQKKLERKIKQVIAENPELKDKISEKLKEIEEGDKYTKIENNTPPPPTVERRVFGGM
jgi:hypothetical protein